MNRLFHVFLILTIPCSALLAQDMPFSVRLTAPLSTTANHKGDPVRVVVLQPEQFRGDSLEGTISELKQGNKIHGESALRFHFDTLLQGGGAVVPISPSITSITNSKRQANVDEQGRVVRKSIVYKTAAGTGAGAMIGGLMHGVKGAALGAGIDAAASSLLIEVAAEGPKIEFAEGSRIDLSVKSRGGPELSNLGPNRAAAGAPQVVAAKFTQSLDAVAAPAQPAGAAPAASDQPDLKGVNIDFIPGEKIIFYDDFSDMAQDEPPPHWKLRDGSVELRTGGGIRQLTTVCPGKPSLHSASFAFPKNFTMEVEVAFATDAPSIEFLAWPKDVDGGQAPTWRINMSAGEVALKGPKDEQIGSFRINPPIVNNPIKVALWVQDGRARAYVNGQRIADVNQMIVPPDMKPADHWTVRERCDRPGDGWMGIRRVRVAESAPDFSAVLSSTGKYVTHGIVFDTDSARLKTESAPVIKAVARALDKNPNLKLEIDGYTDSTGDSQRNQDLSSRRAEAVRSVLVAQFGVDAARLTANGYGPAKPLASNDTPEGRAQNRRVEFVRK